MCPNQPPNLHIPLNRNNFQEEVYTVYMVVEKENNVVCPMYSRKYRQKNTGKVQQQ
jgi:hypothetical protein